MARNGGLPPPPGPARSPESSRGELCERVLEMERELRSCRQELRRIQRQLGRSERLHRSTESRNRELTRQVEELSREIHERQTNSEKGTDQEVQTDDYSTWSYSDYYNYSSHANGYDTNITCGTAVQEVGNSNVEPAGVFDSSVTESAEHSEEPSVPCLGEEPAELYAANVQDEEQGSLAEAARSQTDFTYDESYVKNVSDEEQGSLAEAARSQTDFTYDEGYVKNVSDEEQGSLAESLRATAEAALSQTGFTYDESSGMYYDHNTGFYYDSESQLYYDSSTGIYYYCDVESGIYQFHSRVDLQAITDTNSQPIRNKREKKKRKELFNNMATKEKVHHLTDTMASLKISSFGYTPSRKDADKIWPPCIRVIVVRSPVLEKGSLFIITAVKRATIGREKDMAHTIRIPELGVSKFHAEVYFDQDLQSYVLIDQGSQNGTVINGKQILQPKQVSEPCVLEHGDEVKFGETVLSFHVHPGSDTCDGCEPGQVRAHLRLDQKEADLAGPILSKEGKELLRRQELKQIRVKYGLQSADYEENKALKNSKYLDRAGKRREIVGSEGTFQREDAPSSIHVEINEKNKGRKMLVKMGWKKGDGLGKTGDGLRDPIKIQLRQKKAGLGTYNPSSIEEIQTKTQNKKNWEKARERYAETFPEDKQLHDSKRGNSWVKGSAR
ncbi:angiogenic factor with G patch and FHA domains 1 isoform X2 [Pelobates cultripes]|uniref:Angiogenic factor with G patch and FHA domains 1 n=1 Tax=Pelobates cultripes TaxID=61616 RepID=A0AAD1SCF5_PELCU|nr:angiogenic factor with G patch and FHA domains 1 isoform X2 [Pelobates cultripes]